MSILRFIQSAPQRIQNWNAKRATRAALLKLSDHELEDIGLHRGDVDGLA